MQAKTQIVDGKDWFVTSHNERSHFQTHELACPCCGRCVIEQVLIDRLEEFRKRTGAQKVRSGCRCEKHNRDIGGEAQSKHLIGLAVDLDVVVKGVWTSFLIMKDLFEMMILYPRSVMGLEFIHAQLWSGHTLDRPMIMWAIAKERVQKTEGIEVVYMTIPEWMGSTRWHEVAELDRRFRES